MVVTSAKKWNAVPLLPATRCSAGLSWAGATAWGSGWRRAIALRIVDKVGTHAIEFFRRKRTNSLASRSGSPGSSRGGVTRRVAGAIRRIAIGSRPGSR
jgi:hypothetical protein